VLRLARADFQTLSEGESGDGRLLGAAPSRAHVHRWGASHSRRHFNGRFRDAPGVAPKLAARVFRFERACRLMADKRSSLAHVAIACGYYGQPHLTRESYALAGCLPRAWIARELPFLQDYELGGRDNESDDFESVHQSFI
jgi:AraC-like DNA-binding protein